MNAHRKDKLTVICAVLFLAAAIPAPARAADTIEA